MTTDTESGFLWGASTSPHQTEGNNVNSDWWVYEQRMPHFTRSGDAVDSYHRYEDDMRLLSDAGLNAYRFGIEWARVEPLPGQYSLAELAHYRRMIDTALRYGLTPVVTLHHFSSPRWFIEEGGWLGESALDRFAAYVTRVCDILDRRPVGVHHQRAEHVRIHDAHGGCDQFGGGTRDGHTHSPAGRGIRPPASVAGRDGTTHRGAPRRTRDRPRTH